MSEDNESGLSRSMRIRQEKMNRSKVVSPGDESDFTVSFRDISHPTRFELEDSYDRSAKNFCKIEFIVSRGNQDFVFPIFLKTGSVDPVDYLKEAAHRLHLDLARLAEQTKRFKLRDEDPVEPDPKDTDSIIF